ncbi:hypothetical protein SDC9_85847 [bioreactor metagenome]|uniref:Uncharacterized protein n=1 Tax=bioreactor metagenome TaxID=1076179 RepID=A0A644ZNB1_9ZZZZ
MRNGEVIFFVSSQVVDDIGNLMRVPVDTAVRRFNEAIFVDFCITGQAVDQSDIRALRRFDRTHTAIVGIVNVSDFISSTVSRQTAGS